MDISKEDWAGNLNKFPWLLEGNNSFYHFLTGDSQAVLRMAWYPRDRQTMDLFHHVIEENVPI